MLGFLAFLIGLSYTPMSDALKESFAQWGFWGSVGYTGAKTIQNLIGTKENKG